MFSGVFSISRSKSNFIWFSIHSYLSKSLWVNFGLLNWFYPKKSGFTTPYCLHIWVLVTNICNWHSYTKSCDRWWIYWRVSTSYRNYWRKTRHPNQGISIGAYSGKFWLRSSSPTQLFLTALTLFKQSCLTPCLHVTSMSTESSLSFSVSSLLLAMIGSQKVKQSSKWWAQVQKKITENCQKWTHSNMIKPTP